MSSVHALSLRPVVRLRNSAWRKRLTTVTFIAAWTKLVTKVQYMGSNVSWQVT